MDTVSSNECVSSSTSLRVEKEQNSASFNDVIIFKLKGITPRKFIVFHRGTAYDVIIFRSPLSSASKAYSFRTFRLSSSRHGRPQKDFQRGGGGKTPYTLKSGTLSELSACRTKKSTIFGEPKEQKKMFAILWPFRLNYMVFIASAKDASKTFRVLCRAAAYDVIF